MRPDDVLEVARRIGPEAVEGDVAGAGEAPRMGGRAGRAQQDLDVLERGEDGGERRGGEEEETVEEEKAGERAGAQRGGVALGFIAQPMGECEEAVVLSLVRRVAIPRVENGGRGNNALPETRPDGFVALQPCVETGAQRGQIEGSGAVPVAMAGAEG